LGTRDGHEQNPLEPKNNAVIIPLTDRVVQLRPENLQEETKPEEDNLDGLAPEIAEAVQNIRKIEKSFNIKDFSEGAKAAFEMILNAFAKDERDTLKMLLAKPIYENFIAALDERKSAETKEESTLVAIKSAEITAINLEKHRARVTVKFLSEQIHITRDATGKIIAGDASALDEVEDIWSFERDISSSNPNWSVVEV